MLNGPRGIAVQFRYAFVVRSRRPQSSRRYRSLATKACHQCTRPPPGRSQHLRCPHLCLRFRGQQGLAIIDVEKPDAPKLDQLFTAEGQLNDVNDVKIGMVAPSAFAFVADGKNGLRVLQILSPWDDPAHFSGFSPRPTPKLIATAHTHGPRSPFRKASIATARSMNPAINSRFGRRGAAR